MMHEDGSYFLFYSASNFQLPSYRMMVARSGDLLGPYTKGEVPVVETDWDRCVACSCTNSTSAEKQSIGFTIGFHNHGQGPYKGLLLVESAY